MLEIIKIIILAIYCIVAAAAMICMIVSTIASDIQFRKDRKKLKEDREKALKIMLKSNEEFQEHLKQICLEKQEKYRIEK